MRAAPVQVGSFLMGAGQPFALIAGPCVIESRDECLKTAERVRRVCERLHVSYVFKASFDKANRTSNDAFRGPGIEEGLRILAAVREKTGVPVLSDIHEPSQAAAAGEVLDVLQIPAFLCRQTDLIVAAARSGRAVNLKKGQFMAPGQMRQSVEKVRAADNPRVLVTERGTFFGYGALVNDMTAIPQMQAFAPVFFDATHSCQAPGSQATHTGGRREYVPVLARAATACGCDVLFLEVHERPESAKSDAATVWPLDGLEGLLAACVRIREAAGPGDG